MEDQTKGVEEETMTDKSEEPARPLVAAIKKTDELVYDLGSTLDMLTHRLEPIVRHKPEVVDDNAKLIAIEPLNSSLVDEINNQNERLARLERQLRYLLDTIQI